ncbi:MAG: DUF1467 family protein [Pseudomonadota bacterium]
MTITSAIVLFAVIWSVVFFIVLPFGMVSQAEDGEVEPGTPASAPANAQIMRKIVWTTGIATVVFLVVVLVITSRVITLDDIPFMTPPSAR